MFSQNRTALLWAALLLLGVLSPLLHADNSHKKLDVISAQGDRLMTIPLPDEGSWCLLWNHSVAGFTVSDCFVTKRNLMLLSSSHQPDFAAGLGHELGRGNLVSDGDGGYIITQINEPIPNNALPLRVGSLAVNHRVLVKDQEISLSTVAAGQRVTLRLTQP